MNRVKKIFYNKLLITLVFSALYCSHLEATTYKTTHLQTRILKSGKGFIAFDGGDSYSLFDISGKKIRSFTIPDGGVNNFALCGNDKVLAIASRNELSLFDFDTSKLKSSIPIKEGILNISINANGSLIAVSTRSGEAQIFNTGSAKLIQVIKPDSDKITTVALNANSKTGAVLLHPKRSVATNTSIRFFDISTGQFTGDKIDGHALLHYSRDGQFIITLSANSRKLQLVNVKTLEVHPVKIVDPTKVRAVENGFIVVNHTKNSYRGYFIDFVSKSSKVIWERPYNSKLGSTGLRRADFLPQGDLLVLSNPANRTLGINHRTEEVLFNFGNAPASINSPINKLFYTILALISIMWVSILVRKRMHLKKRCL